MDQPPSPHPSTLVGEYLFSGVRPSSGAAALEAGETGSSSGAFGADTLLLPRTAAPRLNTYVGEKVSDGRLKWIRIGSWLQCAPSKAGTPSINPVAATVKWVSVYRSADFQSAVSPICNRQGAGDSQVSRFCRRSAGYKPAIQQTTRSVQRVLLFAAVCFLFAAKFDATSAESSNA